jgi:Rv0078B-related antitoxin
MSRPNLAQEPAAGVTCSGCQARIWPVDALEADDLESARQLSPAEKLAQALEMMSTGIRLKRAALQRRHPAAQETEIERLLTAWLTDA